MARRTKDEAERTRDAILNAAEKVFYKNGVARSSLEQIAQAARVTRGAVYWHFKDKIEVCEAMMQRVFLPQEDMLERLAESSTNTPLTDLKNACLHSLRLMATDKHRQRVVTILMLRCEYVDEMAAIMKRRRECKDYMLERGEKLFKRAAKLGQLNTIWSPHLAAVALQALMSGLISSALEGRKNFDLATSGLASMESFFAGLSAASISKKKSASALAA